jgi:hypothetical protein
MLTYRSGVTAVGQLLALLPTATAQLYSHEGMYGLLLEQEEYFFKRFFFWVFYLPETNIISLRNCC